MQSDKTQSLAREKIEEEIEKEFGVNLLWYKGANYSGPRDDVTVHGFVPHLESEVTEETKLRILRWLESHGWQTSRQMEKYSYVPDPIERIYLAPFILVKLERGYHATRRASWSSIHESGLLPSVPERQTTADRCDCEGNIYISENLGTLEDADIESSQSAHWWRAHRAKHNRFDDPDWIILEVDVGKMSDCRLYTDIWSKCGVIVSGVSVVPAELIRLVYPIES